MMKLLIKNWSTLQQKMNKDIPEDLISFLRVADQDQPVTKYYK